MSDRPQTLQEAADNLHDALCALWDEVMKTLTLRTVLLMFIAAYAIGFVLMALGVAT